MIKNFLDDDNDQVSHREEDSTIPSRPQEPAVISLFDSADGPLSSSGESPSPQSFRPESAAETIRRTGLAWSMGIAFVGSVGFLMVLGWVADLLLGSSPWGLVVGIVIGSLIGFYQLFRLSSQILKP